VEEESEGGEWGRREGGRKEKRLKEESEGGVEEREEGEVREESE
jgi:hypothetical protein